MGAKFQIFFNNIVHCDEPTVAAIAHNAEQVQGFCNCLFESKSSSSSIRRLSLAYVPAVKSDMPFFTLSTICGISTFVSAKGRGSTVVDLVQQVVILAGGMADCMM